MVSLLAVASGIWLGGIDWIPWVINSYQMQRLEHVDPLSNLFKAHGGIEEELSLLVFMFLLISGNLYYL